jgi:hypothetical protein
MVEGCGCDVRRYGPPRRVGPALAARKRMVWTWGRKGLVDVADVVGVVV